MKFLSGPLWEVISLCKGGGYICCRTNPPHPKRNTLDLYPLHRVLMENKLERYLQPGEIVHHRDENPLNNNIDNLELMTNFEHAKHHARTVKSLQVTCDHCGDHFEVKPHVFRLRKRRNKEGEIFCSRSCGSSGGRGNSKSWVDLTCLECGRGFTIRASVMRTRIKQKNSDNLACSRSCGQQARRKNIAG